MFYSKKQENVNIALGLTRDVRNAVDIDNSYLVKRLEHLVLLMESEIENPHLLSTEGENFVNLIVDKISNNKIFTVDEVIKYLDIHFAEISKKEPIYLIRKDESYSIESSYVRLLDAKIRALISHMGAEEFCGQLEKSFNLTKGCILNKGMNISANENVKKEDSKTGMKTVTVTFVVKDMDAADELIGDIEEIAYNNDKNFIRSQVADASAKEISQYNELQD